MHSASCTSSITVDVKYTRSTKKNGRPMITLSFVVALQGHIAFSWLSESPTALRTRVEIVI
ncbi:hypothetical protein OUZ56_005821 [Daphnia magna]|uniref:Uncharacterized protein n=1 Tax=Daphnia magna TaxID=35525 RepID=A0ABQ9YTV3_9CRUS|nr:hypothetical protein OUZ56_005821 [Daphnia magna]